MNSKVTMGLRILFGIFCLVFGLNKFIGFLPMPVIEGDGGVLMGIYATSGFLNIIGVLEILGGVALLANKFVPLVLTVMCDIMCNAFLIHALHDMAGFGGAALGMILNIALVYAYRSRFSSLLSA